MSKCPVAARLYSTLPRACVRVHVHGYDAHVRRPRARFRCNAERCRRCEEAGSAATAAAVNQRSPGSSWVSVLVASLVCVRVLSALCVWLRLWMLTLVL